MDYTSNVRYTKTPGKRTILKNVFWVNREKSMPVIKNVNLELFSNGIVLHIINPEKSEDGRHSYQLGDVYFEIMNMRNNKFDGLKIYDDIFFVILKDEVKKIRTADASDFPIYSDQTILEADYQGTSLNEADGSTAKVIKIFTTDIKEELLSAFGFPKHFDVSTIKRAVFLDAFYNDKKFTKDIVACNLEIFKNGYRIFVVGGFSEYRSPDNFVYECDLIPMKSGEYFTLVYKSRRKTDNQDSASKEFFLLKNEEIRKVQALDAIKKDLYKLVENEDMAASDYVFEGRSLDLNKENASRLLNSLRNDIRNEFLRMPEELEKAKQEQERAKREQERVIQEQEQAKRELADKKQKVATLPQYLEDLKAAEINLEDVRKHKGLFGGKKVKDAERKVNELKDLIANLEGIKASIIKIERENLHKAPDVSTIPFTNQAETMKSKNNENDRDSVILSFTLDQDGEEVPTVRCSKCNSKDTECLNHETDLYRCCTCGHEFIPEIYRVLISADEYIARGNQNLQERNFKRVIKDATEAIKLAPRNRKAYLFRGKAYAGREQWDEAEKDFTEAIQISPDYDVAFFSRGDARLHLQKFDEAITDLTASIKLDPNFAETYNLRAVGYFNKEDYVSAIHDFSEAIKRAPNNASAFFQRGYSYSKIGEIDKALGDFNTTVELDPYNLSAYYRRGEVYEQKKNYIDAIRDYRKFLELGGKNFDVADETVERINRMRAELDPGDISSLTLDNFQIDENKAATSEGLGLVERLAQMGLGGQGEEKGDWVKTQKLSFMIGEGEKYFSEGRYKESYESFTTAINYDPAEPTTYIMRSFAAYKLRDIDQALSDLSLAISVEPYHSSLCFLRGAISILAGKEDDALGDFVEGIHAQLEKDFNRSVLGKVIAENNQLGIAIRDFAKEIKLEGDEIHQNLIKGVLAIIAKGDIFFEETQTFKEPVTLFTKVIQLDPRSVSAYWCRGFVQQSTEKKVGDYSEAIRLRGNKAIYYLIRGTTKLLESGTEGLQQDISKVVELEPKNTELFEKVGLYYLYKEKKYIQAIAVLSAGIERNSDNPNLIYYRGLAHEKQADLESAISDFEEYINLAENGGKFNIDRVRERIDIVKTGGNTENLSESEDNAFDLGKLLGSLGIAVGGAVQFANNNEDESKLVIDNDKEEENSSGISFTLNSEEDFFDVVTDNDQETARAYFLKGNQDHRNKDYESAINNITCGIQLNPNNALSYHVRAHSFLNLKKFDQALKDYSTYLHLHPDELSLTFPLEIILACMDNKNWSRARDIYTEAISYYPNNANLYFCRGQMNRIMENWDSALVDLNKSIDFDNEVSDYYCERAVIHDHIGNIISAISDCQMTLELRGKKRNIFTGRLITEESGQINVEERIIELQKRIGSQEALKEKTGLVVEEKKIEFAKQHAAKGYDFQELSENDKAIAEYEISINLDPNFEMPYELLSAIYSGRKDWGKAYSYISEAIRINPSNAETRNNLGVVYMETGRFDEAVNAFQSAIKIRPDYASAYHNLGATYIQKQEYIPAISSLTKAIDLDQNKPLTYLYRGYASHLIGDNRSTVGDFKKYCELGGDPTYEVSVRQIQEDIKALEEELGMPHTN